MIVFSPKHRIFLSINAIDFRRQINGITAVCKNQCKQDPTTGHYFLFINRRKTDIKILYYDGQGFCLFQKKLSSGKFIKWPISSSELVTMTSAQAYVLIYNGDPTTAITEPPWLKIDQ